MPDLIVIDMTDEEIVNLDGSLKLKKITGNGKITIKNPSHTSRLWDLTCDLKEVVNTTIYRRDIKVNFLKPTQSIEFEYEIQNLKDSTLKVDELIDIESNAANNVNTTLLYNADNICKLTIILTNPLESPISNINLTREIPDFFQEVKVNNVNSGLAAITEDKGVRILNWDIVSLEGQKRAKLEISFVIKIKDKEVKSLGSLNITYLINNYKLTMINPEIRGLTESMSGIDRNKGSEPGLWDCNIKFVNESEFQVKLEDVKVFLKIPTGFETVVSQTPNKLLNPNQSWDFNFYVESGDSPELNSTIEFTPLFVVIRRVIGEINKESTIYTVSSPIL